MAPIEIAENGSSSAFSAALEMGLDGLKQPLVRLRPLRVTGHEYERVSRDRMTAPSDIR